MIKTISKKEFSKFIKIANAAHLFDGENIIIATDGDNNLAINEFKKVRVNCQHLDCSDVIFDTLHGTPVADFYEFMGQSAPTNGYTPMSEEEGLIIVDGFNLLDYGLKNEYGHFEYDILIVE